MLHERRQTATGDVARVIHEVRAGWRRRLLVRGLLRVLVAGALVLIGAGAALEALRHASGYLRHQVRNLMRLRVAPELDFHIDDSVERGDRLSALIHDAVESDRQRHVDPEPDEE